MKKFLLLTIMVMSAALVAGQSEEEAALLQKADGYFQDKNYEKLVEILTDVLAINPTNYGALLYRAYSNEQLGKVELAYPDLETLKEHYPEDPNAYVQTAWYLMKEGKFTKALPEAEKGYEYGQTIYYYCAMDLGLNHYLLGNKTKGEELLKYSIQIMNSPQDYENALKDLNDFKELGLKPADMQEVIALFTAAYNRVGEHYQKMNEHDRNAYALYKEKDYLGSARENQKAVTIATSMNPPDFDACYRFSEYTAYNYRDAERPKEAVLHYGQAADCIEKGDIVDEKAARMNLSAGLYAKDHRMYAEADRFYTLSLQIFRKLNDKESMATLLSNLAEIKNFQGKFEESISLFTESIQLDEKSGRKDGLAITYNNLSDACKNAGKYSEAISYAQKSVALGDEANLSASSIFYSTLGNAYLAVGEFQKALDAFNTSYRKDKAQGNKIKMAQRLSSMGTTLSAMGRRNEAEQKLLESITLAEAEGAVLVVSNAAHNLGTIYREINQPLKAKNYLSKALELNRKYGSEQEVAANLTMLGLLAYASEKDYYKAKSHLTEAEEIYTRLNLKYQLSEVYHHLAATSTASSQTSEALRFARKGIEIAEELQAQSGSSAVSQLSATYFHYQLLAALYGLNKDYEGAFNTLEKVKAKDLSQKLAGRSQVLPVNAAGLKRKLSDGQVMINYSNTETGAPLFYTISRTGSFGYMPASASELDEVSENFHRLINKYEEEVKATLANQRGFKPKQKAETTVIRENSYYNREKFQDFINYYRTLLVNQAVTGNDEKIREIATGLYEYLISPIANALAGKKELIIIPEGILGYLPFETLIDANGNYLVETYDIQYVHSATVWDLIKKRAYNPSSKKILALGGAIYNTSASSFSSITNDQALDDLKREVRVAGVNQASMAIAYDKLGLGGWENLPGTLDEVNEIKALFPAASIFTGSEVSEQQLKALSASKALSGYSVIHFATHGIVVPEVPELSALVLSQGMSSSEDGYLRAEEIAGLDLKADFVNLSACETGLGKIYGGEGVVGLTQSFLIAGANGLSVSLWQVADKSTMQFMAGLYKKVREGSTYCQAINAMKRDFITGKYGTANQVPYFWAPFAYYGQ